jgi:hypothetical protein
LHQQIGQRHEARFGAGILLQAEHGRRPPFRRYLVIQQDLDALEDVCARVNEGNFAPDAEILLAIVEIDGVDQDLQILRHGAVLLLRQLRLDLVDDRVALRPLLKFIGQPGIRDLAIVLAEALCRSIFG